MNVANLYTIADLDNMQVIGKVDEADIGQVKTGQEVTFSVDAYPDELFTGKVTQVRLNPTTESNVVTYEAVVVAPNPDHKLIPGLTANLTIYVLREKDVLLLPNAAFKFQPEDHTDIEGLPQADMATYNQNKSMPGERNVWIVDNNRLVRKSVLTGASNGISTQILSGLNEGAVVATGYNSTLHSSAGAETAGEQSPFAPKPPGRNKKK